MYNRDTEVTILDTFMYAMEGENPSKAIENQERRGQQNVLVNLLLPKLVNSSGMWDVISKGVSSDMSYEERKEITTKNNLEYTKAQYEKMGIIILSEYDDLFYNVELPVGWAIRATEHSMWNELLDDTGRKRADFFYKAAFYDRDAFINFTTRFHIKVEHTAPADSRYEVWRSSDFIGRVMDGNNIVIETETVPSTGDYTKDDKIKGELRDTLKTYMNNNYPDYEDINAYWDI